MTNLLKQNNSVERFLELSYEFASQFELTNGKCGKALARLKSEGINASVALFGHTLFTIIKSDSLKKVCEILRQYQGQLMVCKIDNLGARLMGLKL